MEIAWPEYLVALGALQRLQPDYDPECLACEKMLLVFVLDGTGSRSSKG